MRLHDPAIAFEAVTKHYGSTVALDGVSFEIQPGETVALLGPNGAGKSTAVSLLLGLRQPDAGRVAVLGTTPHDAVRHGRVGALLQSSRLPDWATVGEVVDLARRLQQRGRPTPELLALAGIEPIAGRRLEGLSGGQAQRVRYALAMAGDPDVVFLDEPTTAMDVEGRRSFWSTLRAMATRRTVLFATHHLDEAEAVADRLIVLAGGRVVADGPTSAVKSTVDQRAVRFHLPSPDPGVLWALPGVVDVRTDGPSVTLHTTDADATVRALCRGGLPFHDLDLAAVSLEDAFLALVQGGTTR